MSVETPNKNIVEDIKLGINNGIKRECGKIFDTFVEDLKKQKEQIVAGICLNVAEHISYRDCGHILTVEISKK